MLSISSAYSLHDLKKIQTGRGNQLYVRNFSETDSLTNIVLSFSMSIILESPTACLLEKYGLHCFQKGFVSSELGMELQ